LSCQSFFLRTRQQQYKDWRTLMAPKTFDYIGTLAVATDAAADEERRLLHRLAQGDTTAFWGLWERYKNTLLLRLCLQWMGGNREDTEDALSSASIKAWRYLSLHGSEITNVKAWLSRLLYNHCMSMHKTRQRHRCDVQPVCNTNGVVNTPSGPVHMSLEDAVLHREMQSYVRGSVDRLPPQLREPLVLYFFQDMSQRDIATHLSLSHDNVRKRLQHARAALHTQIAPYLVQGDSRSVWAGAPSDRQFAALLPTGSEVTSCTSQSQEEITSQVVAMRMVRITLPDGGERHMYLALDHKPARQQQKVETLRAYVQRHPGGWRKQVQLSDLLYTMGHWEESMAALHQVLYRQPRHLNARLRLGRMLHLLQREDEAIAVYESALALVSRTATQHHVEGRIAVCRGRLDEAVRSYTAAAALEPCHVVHWRALGQTHLHTDHPVEALHAFETALEVNPDDLVALTSSYDPLMAMGRYEEAQRRMERAWQLDPGHLLALTRLVDNRCHRRQVRGEAGTQTRALIRRAIQLAPEALEVQVSRARYHVARGEWSAGLAILRQYTTQYPNCPAGWHHYARWCFRTGVFRSAAEAIIQAHVLDPHDAAISQAACGILTSVRRLEDARPLVAEMLQQFPDRWSVWTTAGRVLVETFRDKEYACTVSARGPILQPDLAQAWFRHGHVLALAGNHREAVEVFEQGWQRLPDEGGGMFAAPAALWLGASYDALGAEQQSRTWWETAVQRARYLSVLTPAMGHYWQGKAFAALGQQSSARQAYCMAWRHHLLHPSHQEVKEVLKPPHPNACLSVLASDV
jgi:RNA polymerase sigma factor (sigma-70 family)